MTKRPLLLSCFLFACAHGGGAPASTTPASPAASSTGEGAQATTAAPKEITTSSGLRFLTLKPGTGKHPTADSTVTVHYRGSLTDGTVFDTSIGHGPPPSFPLRGVIPCWTEGVQLMQVGELARLTCPSSIAYGDHGHPPVIPGGATLIFEVQLIGIE